MSKIGSGPPAPHHHHHHPAPVGRHQRGVKGAQKTTDPSQVQVDENPLDVDQVEDARAVKAKGDSSGFDDPRQPNEPLKRTQDEPGAALKDGSFTLSEPHLQAMLAAICTQLDALAEQINDAGLQTPGQPDPGGLSLKHAATAEQLRDILRQVMCGDFGFKPTIDPNTTLGRLFSKLKGWPKSVPPGRKPDASTPWSGDEWDAFVSWLNTPPPLPGDDELFG